MLPHNVLWSKEINRIVGAQSSSTFKYDIKEKRMTGYNRISAIIAPILLRLRRCELMYWFQAAGSIPRIKNGLSDFRTCSPNLLERAEEPTSRLSSILNSFRHFDTETLTQNLPTKVLTLEFVYFSCQLCVLENVWYPLLEVSALQMKIQGLCTNFLDTRQESFVRVCAYTCVHIDVNEEVERRNLLRLAEAQGTCHQTLSFTVIKGI